MNRKLIVLIVVGCVSIFALYALVIGGTNFGITGYPKFSAFKPYQPYSSYGGTVTKREYDNYRNEVLDYIDKAQTYLDNADNDIKRIKEAKDDVLKTANQIIDEFNDWSKRITISSY